MHRAMAIVLLSAAAANGRAADVLETRVLPVFREHCFACHSAQSGRTKGGLALDTAEGLRKGGDSGPVIVAGKPDESRLIRAVRYGDEDLQMPPKGRLPDTDVAALVEWVRSGAVDMRSVAKAETWWSLQPLTRPAVPASDGWCRT